MVKSKANGMRVAGILLGIAALIGIGYALLKKNTMTQSIDISQPRGADGVPRILFIGSSSTAATNGYVDQLKAMWPEIEVTKVAQVGATTTWMVENAMGEISSAKYDAVVIFGGLNDIYATGNVQQAKDNLSAMYDATNAAKSILVAITVQPTNNYSAYNATRGEQTIDLNNWIWAQSRPDWTIDLYHLLLNENGLVKTYLYEPDGLHLNADGHALLAAEIDNVLFI